MSGRGLVLRLALVGGCALLSALEIAWTSNRFLLAASMPAMIWMPRGGLAVAVVPTAAAVLVVGLVRRRRLGALLVWLVVLALVTHRVVDIGEDGASDVWLGVPIRIAGEFREQDGEARPCGLALCVMRAGRVHRLPTLLPFEVMR